MLKLSKPFMLLIKLCLMSLSLMLVELDALVSVE